MSAVARPGSALEKFFFTVHQFEKSGSRVYAKCAWNARQHLTASKGITRRSDGRLQIEAVHRQLLDELSVLVVSIERSSCTLNTTNHRSNDFSTILWSLLLFRSTEYWKVAHIFLQYAVIASIFAFMRSVIPFLHPARSSHSLPLPLFKNLGNAKTTTYVYE